MIRNYLKTVLRNLFKNKVTSFINIFGLSMAIGCSSVVYVFINWQLSYDSFHKNSDRIFNVQNLIVRSGNSQIWGFTPGPLGAALVEDFPQIEKMVRLDSRSGVFRYDETLFNENIWFADPDFTDMFSFPIEQGSKDALLDPAKIIISDNIAKKYFGNENPVGKQITISFSDHSTESFEVGAVFAKFPVTASFKFNILLNYDKLKIADPAVDFNDWGDFITSTFIQVKDPTDINALKGHMGKYVQLQNAKRFDWPSNDFVFEPLQTLALKSYQVGNSLARGDDPTGRIVLGILGAFLLALACFNYINIAIVSASKRLKEIGLRKVMGGNRKMIISQFIMENLVVTLIAMILGLALGYFLFVPSFNEMFQMELEFSFIDPHFWFYFILVLLITGIGSGFYPALYISSFQAVDIFRGQQRFGTKNLFTRVFLTFQFVLALILIVAGIAFTENALYQKKRDWGYEHAQILSVPVPTGDAYGVLKNEVIQNPDVLAVAGSTSHMGRSSRLAPVEIESETYEFNMLDFGDDYLQTMGLRLKEGRFFDKEKSSDYDQSILINEMLAKKMNWDEPVGKIFIYDSTRYQVIGVLQDFHYYSFWNQIRPTFIRFRKQEDYRYLLVKTKTESMAMMNDYLKATWKKLFPERPYDGFFQDDVMLDYLTTTGYHGKLMRFVAVFAIILACMGLYGLVSLRVRAKIKDFSIKKVLGAQLKHLVTGVSKQFIWVLSIAVILGSPLAYILVAGLFDLAYAYHMPMSSLPVFYAVAILAFISILTVSTIVYGLIKTNPVDNLRSE